jgi:hypothetical protein
MLRSTEDAIEMGRLSSAGALATELVKINPRLGVAQARNDMLLVFF